MLKKKKEKFTQKFIYIYFHKCRIKIKILTIIYNLKTSKKVFTKFQPWTSEQVFFSKKCSDNLLQLQVTYNLNFSF